MFVYCESRKISLHSDYIIIRHNTVCLDKQLPITHLKHELGTYGRFVMEIVRVKMMNLRQKIHRHLIYWIFWGILFRPIWLNFNWICLDGFLFLVKSSF